MKKAQFGDKGYLCVSGEKRILNDSLSFSDPLSLFRELNPLSTNTQNPLNVDESKPPATPAGPPLPDNEPTFTPEDERRLCDFYASLDRAARLTIHRRSLYIRAEKGWAWAACDLHAIREAREATRAAIEAGFETIFKERKE